VPNQRLQHEQAERRLDGARLIKVRRQASEMRGGDRGWR